MIKIYFLKKSLEYISTIKHISHMYNKDLRRIEQMPHEIKDENFLKLTKNAVHFSLFSH